MLALRKQNFVVQAYITAFQNVVKYVIAVLPLQYLSNSERIRAYEKRTLQHLNLMLLCPLPLKKVSMVIAFSVWLLVYYIYYLLYRTHEWAKRYAMFPRGCV